jgi:hypothetical protein
MGLCSKVQEFRVERFKVQEFTVQRSRRPNLKKKLWHEK